jgi:hypothetical protein
VQKKPYEIRIRVTYQPLDQENSSNSVEDLTVTLDQKLYEYAVRAKGATAGIVFQLFTQGKVSVKFGDFIERLELLDPHDKLSGPDSMILFEEFLTRSRRAGIQLFNKSTQSIIFPTDE